MTIKKTWDIFNYWFENQGHWIFGVNGKEKAIIAWKKNGIDGLPNYIDEIKA